MSCKPSERIHKASMVGFYSSVNLDHIMLVGQAVSCDSAYHETPRRGSVAASISEWVKIMALLASWKPADLLQEEEIENLKAIIGRTMKAIQRGERPR